MTQITLSEFASQMNELLPVIIRGFARRQSNELYKGKITLPQFLTLEFLYREGQSKMTSLAQFMNVTTAAMTGIVKRLVRNGYVTRVDDASDRRIIKINLTGRGNGLVKRLKEQRQKMLIKIFGRISEEDRQNYLRILKQIRDILTLEKSGTLE